MREISAVIEFVGAELEVVAVPDGAAVLVVEELVVEELVVEELVSLVVG